MPSLIGSGEYDFAIYASHSADDTYSVVIFPEAPETGPRVDVPAAKFKNFLAGHKGQIEGDQTFPTDDVFIHSLSVADLRELTAR